MKSFRTSSFSRENKFLQKPSLIFIIGTFLVAMFACNVLQAQNQQQSFPSDFFNQGKAVLEAGDTVRGQIKYSLKDDIIQILINNHVENYTPRKVVFFEIFDQTVRQYRQFYSLPYAIQGQYKAPVFFELMQEGKLTLLCRENVEYKTYSNSYYYGSYQRLTLVNHFFFLKEDGVIYPFNGDKKDLFKLMGQYGDDVKRFTKENKINFDAKYGMGAIVKYYNSIVK